MDEQAIIKGLKAGENSAYEWLYKLHYSILCKFANTFVNDTYIAQSVVNDVFFALWQNRDILEIRSLRQYLLRSVRNRCLNYLKQQGRQDGIETNVDAAIEKATPMERLLEKELDIKIAASMAALPQLTSNIFALSRFNRMKYHEIAQHIGVSVDVVKYHIKQALLRLRIDLKDYFE